MRLFVVATYFREFRRAHYRAGGEPDAVALARARLDWAYDLLVYGPRSHATVTLSISNDRLSQLRWAEQSVPAEDERVYWEPQERALAEAILLDQLRAADPDVVLLTNVFYPSPRFRVRLRCELPRVIRIAQCSTPADRPWLEHLDGVLTISDHVERQSTALGIVTARHSYCFNPQVLELLGEVERQPQVVYVGQLGAHHHDRRRILHEIAAYLPIAWCGPRIDLEHVPSSLQQAWRGEAFGLDMYRHIASGGVEFNCPADFDRAIFSNLRTYETLGVGTSMVCASAAKCPPGFASGRTHLEFTDGPSAVTACQRLLGDAALNQQIGQAGQRAILRHYASPVVIPRTLTTIRALASRTRRRLGTPGRSPLPTTTAQLSTPVPM